MFHFNGIPICVGECKRPPFFCGDNFIAKNAPRLDGGDMGHKTLKIFLFKRMLRSFLPL